MLTTLTADHTIHSGWGDHISWYNVDWPKVNFNTDHLRVEGHMPRLPRAGETLLAEFERGYVKFEFCTVEPQFDPPDQFFATVKAIAQQVKTPAKVCVG